MAAVLHEGYVFVIGGLNYTEKCLRKCERFQLLDMQNKGQIVNQNSDKCKWKRIADLKEPRKNASACSMTADTIYVFGGTSNSH